MRPPIFAAALLLGALLAVPAVAQQAAAPPPLPLPTPAEPDPPVARVNGEVVRLSEVIVVAAEFVPPELRAMSAEQLLQRLQPGMAEQLVERTIVERALVQAARRAGLENNPMVRRRVQRAEEQELQQALLAREAVGAVTPELVRQRYERLLSERDGEEEVQARHILVREEAEAREAIAELAGGADFAAVAARRSTDPGSRATGGDLGFFKRDQMVPEFAVAAFALQPGQVTPAPVRSPFGWHVIKVEARRTPDAPTFEAAGEQIRQQLLQERVGETVQRVRAAATVERLGAGAAPAPSGRSLLDGAAPPPPPARR